MIDLFVALPAEARPLVRHFGLCPAASPPGLRLWTGENLRLAISGVGQAAAATAVEALRTLRPEPSLWIDIGIAGHGDLEIGTLLIADEVTAAATGEHWIPRLPTDLPCATSALITVDRPEERYEPPCAYDMEAAGLFRAARRTAPARSVHALKVVSDNPHGTHRRLSRGIVEDLITCHLDSIADLIRRLAAAGD